MSILFDVHHISIDRLMNDWRWLCSEPVLLARSAFGNLFLLSETGKVLKLDVSVGQLVEICGSETEFRALVSTAEKRQEWFAEDDQKAAAERGLIPDSNQCIAFKIPLIFAESGGPDNVYLADLYEQVSFLGDLNRQLANTPDGQKVRLSIKD